MGGNISSCSSTVHCCIAHATQSNWCCVKLPASFLLSYSRPTTQSLTALTTRFTEPYSSMSVNCESPTLKKSSSDRLKTAGKAACSIEVKKRNFWGFCVSQGSAEALIRWCGKLNQLSSTWFPNVHILFLGHGSKLSKLKLQNETEHELPSECATPSFMR